MKQRDVLHLQADNNSTDIHLNSGNDYSFKTLKHFENVMSYPFVRIHNSYIVNMNFVSRIHTGNSVCHIKNTTTKFHFLNLIRKCRCNYCNNCCEELSRNLVFYLN
jgi:DNA-binding LytR/AlgR family response regulator